MMTQLMAEVAGADPMISGNWLIGLIGALCTGAAAIIGKVMGRKEGENSREVTVKKPVPTIQVREEAQWATKPDLEDHKNRTDKGFREVWEAIDGERKVARNALGNIHARIDKQVESLAKMEGSLESLETTTGKLLDLALGKGSDNKPPTKR
jgi:hypothetical protein